VCLLKKDEAERVLREVIEVCKKIGIEDIALVPPSAGDPLSKGHQIHIQTQSMDFSMNTLVPVIERHSLSFSKKVGQIIIYKPNPIYLKRN
jgi:hypothetical protein